jgi:hypothetical protein
MTTLAAEEEAVLIIRLGQGEEQALSFSNS